MQSACGGIPANSGSRDGSSAEACLSEMCEALGDSFNNYGMLTEIEVKIFEQLKVAFRDMVLSDIKNVVTLYIYLYAIFFLIFP